MTEPVRRLTAAEPVARVDARARSREALGAAQGQARAHRAARAPRSRRHRVRARAGAHRAAPRRRADDDRLLPRAEPPREPRAREAPRPRAAEDQERATRSGKVDFLALVDAHEVDPDLTDADDYEVLTDRRPPPRRRAAEGALRRPAARRRRDRDDLRRVPERARAARRRRRGGPAHRDRAHARPRRPTPTTSCSRAPPTSAPRRRSPRSATATCSQDLSPAPHRAERDGRHRARARGARRAPQLRDGRRRLRPRGRARHDRAGRGLPRAARGHRHRASSTASSATSSSRARSARTRRASTRRCGSSRRSASTTRAAPYGGGRRDKGGFRIPIGFLGRVTDRAQLWQLVEHAVRTALLRQLGRRAHARRRWSPPPSAEPS